MIGILNWGETLIIWLQSLGSWLVGPMEFFSFLGSEEFYLMIAPAILWCWNFNLGLRMGLFLMINASLNGIFKMLLHGPRPYWVNEQVHAFAAETSFGVPSGHAQNAIVVWGTLAAKYGKRLGWVIAVIIIFFIGLSRLVLGMHYPHDVIVGWLFGGLVLWFFYQVSTPLVKWLKRQKTYVQYFVVFVGSMVLILVGFITEWGTSNFYLPSEWINNATTAHPDIPIAPFSISRLISNAGAFFGLATGAIWLEQTGRFSTQGKWWQLALRYIIGLVGVLIFWFGLGQVLPRGEDLGPYVLLYLRYALLGGWVTGLAPYLFRKLGLTTGS